jgi:hypothetical protein
VSPADPFTTAVKTTIRRLRAKLGDPPVIHTVREGGYRIGPSPFTYSFKYLLTAKMNRFRS